MLPHFKRKIFVKAKSETFEADKRKRKAETQRQFQIKGDEAKAFYESVINQPSTSGEKTPKRKNIKIKIEVQKQDYSEVKNVNSRDFFIAAEQDRVDFIKEALNIKSEFLNILDCYGWTPLMVASKAGSVNVVKYLISENANTSIKDKAGHDCFTLALNDEIRLLLTPKPKIQTKFKKTKLSKDYSCEICQIQDLTEDQYKSHLSSTVHQLKIHGTNPNPKVHYVIPEANKGFQMMLNSGWESNKGLGPPGKSGKLFPVRTALKRDRQGLGLEKSEKKVTHFQPFDTNSVKKVPKKNEHDRIERNSTVSKRNQTQVINKQRQSEVDFRREFL